MNRFKGLVLLCGVALLSFGCGAEQAKETPLGADQAPAPKAPSGPTGRIHGIVRFKGNKPRAAVETINQDQKTCGENHSVPRLVLSKNDGVQRAFVYLDGVASVQDLRPRQPVLIDQKDCQYAPQAVTVPVGTKLEITNSDPILHNVHGQEMTGEGLQTIFNVAQPVRGQHTIIEPGLSRPGIVALTCEAGHPWMTAYVFVANHPYAAVTNDEGEFVIPDVPVGTYKIKMWHEGVTMKRNIKTLQRYEYEDPYEITQEVVVQDGADAVVNFELTLR
ncbi:MAG TPA: carboxypeptidase regulatory-like domain-containing protein [Terriglobia bacterium]|nr:carboxypeptidase regulatory-like domain-containing protein [Terriglobia bacterium]